MVVSNRPFARHSLVMIYQFALEHPVPYHEEQRLAGTYHRALYQSYDEGIAVIHVGVQARSQGASLSLFSVSGGEDNRYHNTPYQNTAIPQHQRDAGSQSSHTKYIAGRSWNSSCMLDIRRVSISGDVNRLGRKPRCFM